MLMADPVLIPTVPSLLTSPLNHPHLLMDQGVSLAAWEVTGDRQESSKYHQKLNNWSTMPGDQAHKLLMNQPGKGGPVGVMNQWIHFRPCVMHSRFPN